MILLRYISFIICNKLVSLMIIDWWSHQLRNILFNLYVSFEQSWPCTYLIIFRIFKSRLQPFLNIEWYNMKLRFVWLNYRWSQWSKLFSNKIKRGFSLFNILSLNWGWSELRIMDCDLCSWWLSWRIEEVWSILFRFHISIHLIQLCPGKLALCIGSLLLILS